MSVEYRIVVPGKPVPWSKGAPPGRGPQVPERQGDHASLIRQTFREKYGRAPAILHDVAIPVRVVGEFRICRPKKFYGSGRNERVLKIESAPMMPTTKPDLSNLLKMVEDALTGIVWADDDQVVDISGSKRLIDHWETPCSIVTITPFTFSTVAEFRQLGLQ